MESSMYTNSYPNSYPTQAQAPPQQLPNFVPNPFSNKNNEPRSRRTFQHLPNTNNPQNQPQFSAPVIQPPVRYGADEMRAGPQASKIVRMYSASSSQPAEFALKKTSLVLGGGRIIGGRVIRADKPASTYDLVEPMQFLFVRVVKARDLPMKDLSGSLDPYVEVCIGNYKGITRHFEKNQNHEWNHVIGNQLLKTKPVQARTMNAFWNEDLMFVAAEPFEDHLILTVEDRVGPNKDEVLGKVIVPLNSVERRADDRLVHSC
ncbi:FT-interacting protein 4 [Camellia lanceoleosa]|uniref:FT-interacting protein 4 n=1 Tax=Camellia lanceoleosa TaxID=1840588 RepID=A0ACC0FIJ6_9ERIC|nr:FT-interacting protein 4 [Camellia lanceoleosa]